MKKADSQLTPRLQRGLARKRVWCSEVAQTVAEPASIDFEQLDTMWQCQQQQRYVLHPALTFSCSDVSHVDLNDGPAELVDAHALHRDSGRRKENARPRHTHTSKREIEDNNKYKNNRNRGHGRGAASLLVMVMVMVIYTALVRSHQSTSAGSFGLVRPAWIRYTRSAVPQLNQDVEGHTRLRGGVEGGASACNSRVRAECDCSK